MTRIIVAHDIRARPLDLEHRCILVRALEWQTISLDVGPVAAFDVPRDQMLRTFTCGARLALSAAADLLNFGCRPSCVCTMSSLSPKSGLFEGLKRTAPKESSKES